MTADKNAAHTQDTPITHSHKAHHVRHWFFPQLLKTLAITCVLNILIWGGVIATLPFFGPEIEHFLFPSVKHIQKIRNELDRVHVIQDERGKELASLSTQTHKEISDLKETVRALSDQVKALQDRPSASIAGLAAPESNEISVQWNLLLKNVDTGEPFEAQLHALDPFIVGNKDALMAVHALVNEAAKKTVPFSKLATDLVLIKEKLTHVQRDPGNESTKESWIAALWEKAKNHISFERTDQIAITLDDPSQKNAIVAAIDLAIGHIEKHHFDAAINTIKKQAVHAKPTFDQWLSDADVRLSVEQKIEILRQRITPILNQKVN